MKKRMPHEDDIVVGANIRKLRLARSMSQEKLAEALGLTFQQVQKYEKGVNRVSGSRILQISRVLDYSLEHIFAGAEAGTNTPPPNFSKQAVQVAQYFDLLNEPAKRNAVLALIRAMVPNGGSDQAGIVSRPIDLETEAAMGAA